MHAKRFKWMDDGARGATNSVALGSVASQCWGTRVHRVGTRTRAVHTPCPRLYRPAVFVLARGTAEPRATLRMDPTYRRERSVQPKTLTTVRRSAP